MHRGNATASPRPRFGRQRQTPITLIQPGRQSSQPGFHSPKSVIVWHSCRICRRTQFYRSTRRHVGDIKHSSDRTSYYITSPKHEAEQIKSRIAVFLRDELKLEL